jgi:hypothetical protein
LNDLQKSLMGLCADWFDENCTNNHANPRNINSHWVEPFKLRNNISVA